ncbi:hypothetical protein CK203_065464 [Vitis vinifera]|uniref:Uncharacterized protein n=1 Tax=Vitis vinifera TaxID=29760 RepID=A0A438G3D6_VITVI|nr:hypothetical protein CK203_065464 [Vitis vinifera]
MDYFIFKRIKSTAKLESMTIPVSWKPRSRTILSNFEARPRSASTGPTSSRPTSQTLSKTSPQLGGDHLRRQPGSKTSSQVGGDHHRREPGQPPPSRRLDLIKEVSLKDRELRIVGEVGAKIRVLDFISPDVQKKSVVRLLNIEKNLSECDGLEVVRNPKRPIGAWIHYYNDQLAMMKEKDKGVKINDDLYLQTRCSPERVIRVIENLEPKQKAAIEEIGFGSLLQLRYIDSIKKMNWAEFVLSYLVHGIEEFKKKQQSGVCGCLLFLMLFYHEHISFEEKFLPLYTRPSPRITAWGDDEVLDRKRRLKKLGGYANEDLKIWVIENEIRDCVDGNATTMASENEDDEKFVSNLNKDVIKRVDGGKLMEMDKTFQQLKTHLLDMAYGASSSSCDKILAKFEENYTQVKGLFLRSSGKPLRMHEEGTKNDMLSCERSLEDTNNMNVNEHYLHTLSNEKLCTEDLNEKNEDACATSIEVHIIPDENENIYHFQSKGVEEIMERERKPSKFKVSPFVQKSRKMVKREASESIPMSIREDVVDTQSFNVLQSLVADYVFNKALSKSELLVDFGHEHGVRGDFACLRPRQNLMDVGKMSSNSPLIGSSIPTQENGWDYGVHVIRHMQRFKNVIR